MKNYRDANILFKAKKKGGACTVSVGPDMLLVKEDVSTYGLTFRGSPIIRYYRDDTIMLIGDADCGTASLRTRLNKYSPDDIKVFQRKFRFYVKFFGVTIPLNGELIFDPVKREICITDLFFT